MKIERREIIAAGGLAAFAAGNIAHSLQRYDQRFKGMDRIDQSKLDVWVPVCPR